ncbi:uncharacterized protein TNCT_141491 [Trichonephila clavata]|uniref:Uncharacterized protein n=1 Tax=Trichonephila clavata TaxID=2740835 RepID=A0A8X6IGS7_TRICU|nr:uncharacterized protein TNCT_141491 [Trichonephila clavata]
MTEKIITMEKRIITIEKSFQPILFLFHITGLESYPKQRFLKHTRLHHFIWESPRYLFPFLQCLGIVSEALAVILLKEKKASVSVLIIALLLFTVNLQTGISRKKIRVILIKLCKCSQMLQLDQNGRKFQASILTYCFVMITSFVSYTLLYRFSNAFETYKNLFENANPSFLKSKQYVMLIPEIIVIISPIMTALVMIPLTGYYGFVCIYVKLLFNRIEEKIGHLSKSSPYMPLIQSYLELIGIMKSLDDYLCFSAFVIVLSTMFGLFFLNFKIMFRSSDYLSSLFGEIWFLVSICMIIISASAANNAFFTTKETIQSLPWKIPQYHTQLKMIIRCKCMRSVSLTLWKVYKIERSLIFSAMGTLVTYGILLATLSGPK